MGGEGWVAAMGIAKGRIVQSLIGNECRIASRGGKLSIDISGRYFPLRVARQALPRQVFRRGARVQRRDLPPSKGGYAP